MLRVWGKLWQKNRIVQSHTAQDGHRNWPEEVRLESCIDEIIQELDLPRPIWLPRNKKDMEQFRATHFNQDHFIEHFPYQSFEVEIIEVDDEEETL